MYSTLVFLLLWCIYQELLFPGDGQIICPKVYCFTFQSTQTLALTQKSRSKPANLFTFDVPSFHPIYATTFLLGFFQHIIIEGQSFDSAIGLLVMKRTISILFTVSHVLLLVSHMTDDFLLSHMTPFIQVMTHLCSYMTHAYLFIESHPDSLYNI